MHEPKILFATDLNGDVTGGLQLATRLARERAATLIVLHVVPIDLTGGEGGLYRAVDLASGRCQREVESLVPIDPGVPFLHALEVGNPEERIAAFVEREGVDLLVMESRSRSLVRRVLGRSLVERLTDRVHCPVVSYRQGSVHEEPGQPLRSTAPARTSAAEALTTVLDARVSALLGWMHLQREAVLRIAHDPAVRDAVATLSRARHGGPGSVFIPKVHRLLELTLGEHQRALGALGVEVMSHGQTILRLGLGARRNAAHGDFVRRLRRQGAAVSIPLEPAGDPSHASCAILAGAGLLRGEVDDAQLVFTLDARRDFLRILAQPGPAPSAETYAFDDQGLMLSNSRFPDQLRRVGLLPTDPGVQTPRRLRICDPGGNILTGPVTLGAARPLTRMAAAATAGESGSDWSGYRDYRGVEVVGTWRWLADHGFGVAAEMDRAPV